MDANTSGALNPSKYDGYGDARYSGRPGSDEPFSWDNLGWRSFFRAVADQIWRAADPVSVLDVGCGPGLLVQALCERGIDAYGVDTSQYDIDAAHPDVLSRLSVGSPQKLSRSWDLITCIGGLEPMVPVEAERTISAMTSASDRVLLSLPSTDTRGPTSDTLRDPTVWSASFADQGFFRRTDVDFSLLGPWAGLFERAALTKRDLVCRYEHDAMLFRLEMFEKRQIQEPGVRRQLENTKETLEILQKVLDDTTSANLDLRHRLLTSRDHAIGAEAEVARSQQQFEECVAERDEARAEAARSQQQYEECVAERDEARAEAASMRKYTREMRTSTTWRIGSAIVRPISRILARRR